MPTYEDSSEHYDFDPDKIIVGAISSALLSTVQHAYTDSCIAEGWVECGMTGDRARGTFLSGDGEGNYSVLAWAGRLIVAFEYQLGFGPVEQLGLDEGSVTGGAEDLRGFLPDMPAELESVMQQAAALLQHGPDGALTASAGLWVTPDAVGCSVFGQDDAYTPGRTVLRWGVGPDEECEDQSGEDDGAERAVRAEAFIDALVARRKDGRVALTADEAAAILATGTVPRDGGIDAMKEAFAAAGLDWPA